MGSLDVLAGPIQKFLTYWLKLIIVIGSRNACESKSEEPLTERENSLESVRGLDHLNIFNSGTTTSDGIRRYIAGVGLVVALSNSSNQKR